MEFAIVSACLLGLKCRYDAEASPNPSIIERIEQGDLLAIPVCPEQMGGLPTPRIKCEIKGGDGGDVLSGEAVVLDEEGKDRTKNFLQGAYAVLRIAKMLKIEVAYLKQKSPSCGFGFIKSGGKTVSGNGVTAELLFRYGMRVVPVD